MIYESRLELARLLVADFDLSVAAVAAQPFWLRMRISGRVRRHVPDFFLVRADESAQLVNVKPASRLADPAVAEALEWPGRLARDHGWDYEIWTGADPVYLANVRFLAGYRRPWAVPPGTADSVLARWEPGDTLAALADRAAADHGPGGGRAAVLRLLWEQRLTADLHPPSTAAAYWRQPVDESVRAALSAGTTVLYDGQWWEVAELAPPSVLLAAAGTLRRVSVSHLLAAEGTRLGEANAPAWEGTLRLAGLDDTELAGLRERVAHVREACTGYRHGSPELAQPGEPRPEYAPGTSNLQRYQAKADELGVGVRTVRRWAADLNRYGPAGLVDSRRGRQQAPGGGADSRWLKMARTVLAEHADASTPTQDLVLARIEARLEAEYGAGTVPLPGKTRARALLLEISRGTSAFGGAKARREIAGRPAAPYGRLEATRPGEYLLLETTRLDVFAMDPVTLRWVQAELTIAMDLYDRCITGLRLTPVSTKAVDAAAVLFESVRPLPEPAAGWADVRPPYHGLPGQVVIDAARLADQDGAPLLPSVAAETVVVDYADPPVMPTRTSGLLDHKACVSMRSA